MQRVCTIWVSSMKEQVTWWDTAQVKLRGVMHVTWIKSELHNVCLCSKRGQNYALSFNYSSIMDSYLCQQCVCGGDEWVKWGWLSTLRAWSLSSSWATSLPQACAILLPATRFPTIIEAGPTSVQHNHIYQCHQTCRWSQGQHSYQHKNIHNNENM